MYPDQLGVAAIRSNANCPDPPIGVGVRQSSDPDCAKAPVQAEETRRAAAHCVNKFDFIFRNSLIREMRVSPFRRTRSQLSRKRNYSFQSIATTICALAGVAELADAADSKSAAL